MAGQGSPETLATYPDSGKGEIIYESHPKGLVEIEFSLDQEKELVQKLCSDLTPFFKLF